MVGQLYRLREWLTVPDAAAHLSIAFGEDVTEAEVLRLGLDGHLKLSVNFVNAAKGLFGRVVKREQAEARPRRYNPFACVGLVDGKLGDHEVSESIGERGPPT